MLPNTTKTDISTFPEVVRAMLADSGERWLTTKDRSLPENAILICTNPPRAFALSSGYLTGTTEWACDEGHLDGIQLSEFFAKFGMVYQLWLESKLGGKFRVRAFIKDGQDDWNFSVNTKAGE